VQSENFAQAPNGGLIVTGGGVAVRYRNLIVTLAAKWKMPAIYFERSFTAIGGLMSYGPNQIELFSAKCRVCRSYPQGVKSRRSYQCRPRPTYELAINRKTAKSLGLELPASFLAAADEVIE